MARSRISFATDEERRRDEGFGSGAASVAVSPTLSRVPTTLSMETVNAVSPKHTTRRTTETTERSLLLAPSYHESLGQYTDRIMSSPRSRSSSRIKSYASSWKSHRHRNRRPSEMLDKRSPIYTRTGLRTPKLNRSVILDEVGVDAGVWYDQFTSTDWVHDIVADGYRALELRKRRDIRGRLWLIFDAAQGWILVALIGCLTAVVAYMIDVSEAAIFDLKRGHCGRGWWLNQVDCCAGKGFCQHWHTWSQILYPSMPNNITGNCIAFTLACVTFASMAHLLTLLSRTVVPLQIASTFDENLGAEMGKYRDTITDSRGPTGTTPQSPSVMTYYSVAGSGVAEVKVILSGFVLHGYLGLRTLALKCPALVLSVASGMSVGKEGPYVHIATCIGNIACRMFSKYNLNDAKRREVLSAAAAGGLTVAFGSPLAGVLFSLEEVSYYFPPKTLFRTFFCCIAAALSLKFLNPYGTSKIVPFEVRYDSDWHIFELLNFTLLGIIGGAAGAAFIKASRIWAHTFRRWEPIKTKPWLEVVLVASTTGIISFWNRYARLSVSELLFELASPCDSKTRTGLCPKTREEIPAVIGYLSVAFLIKAFLTIITFGIKVPAGIYVPSMVCGGLMGRIFGHTVQYALLSPSSLSPDHQYPLGGSNQRIEPGVYALVAAGATMCGVTRLSVTLAVILFELTGSLDHVLPFAIGVLTAKWVADYLEPYSIYDLLIEMNSYPFMDNKHMPLFDTDTELGDITPCFRGEKIIDISISPYVQASELRTKLDMLHQAGEFDSGLPIIREKSVVGFIPAPDLEYALDKIDGSENDTLCLMSDVDPFPTRHTSQYRRWSTDSDHNIDYERESFSISRSGSLLANANDESDDDSRNVGEVDFRSSIDPAPITLDVHSPMNLVYQYFSKLGLRYICVVEAGEYRGLVHKKLFVKYLKTCDAKHE